jgi:hypothetical protein
MGNMYALYEHYTCIIQAIYEVVNKAIYG